MAATVSQFPPSELQFSKPLPMQRGGHIVGITAGNGNKVVFQTPRLRAPWGVSAFSDGEGSRYSLAMALPPGDFRAWLEEVDAVALAAVQQQHGEWFGGRAFTPQVLAELFTRSVKPDPSGRFDPTLRLTVPVYGSRGPQVSFFNAAKERVEMDQVAKGSNVIGLVELTGLWFFGKRMGVKWTLKQVMVLPPSGPVPLPSGFAFVEEDV